jgi:GNAT superfamily N-acetyltransferase
MDELDRFYGAIEAESADLRIPQVAASLFQEPRAGYVSLAWEDEQLAGMAAYSFLWPAVGVTRSLYLKELYVIEAFRRKGIGTLLIQEVCQIAIMHACSRIEWTADAGNTLAEAFYERLGALKSWGKILYRAEGEGIRRLPESCRK